MDDADATGGEDRAGEDGASGDGEGDLFVHEDGDRTVYVARDEAEIGSEGAFLVAYLSPDRERRYGWFCTNCESLDNAMDSMGRIECNVCPNYRKPTEWDAAHE